MLLKEQETRRINNADGAQGEKVFFPIGVLLNKEETDLQQNVEVPPVLPTLSPDAPDQGTILHGNPESSGTVMASYVTMVEEPLVVA